MPNEQNFFFDDRDISEKSFWREPCMTNCLPGTAQIKNRARVIDVTPESGQKAKVE